MARLVAKSPKVTLAGRSTSMAGADVGSSSAGSRPAATASAQASSTAARTRARIAVGAATGSAGMVTGDLLAGLNGKDAILPPGPCTQGHGTRRCARSPRPGWTGGKGHSSADSPSTSRTIRAVRCEASMSVHAGHGSSPKRLRGSGSSLRKASESLAVSPVERPKWRSEGHEVSGIQLRIGRRRPEEPRAPLDGGLCVQSCCSTRRRWRRHRRSPRAASRPARCGLRGRRRPRSAATPPSNPGNIPAGLSATLSDAQDWLDGNGINGLVDPADPPTSFIFRDAVDSPNNIAGDATPDTSAYVGGNKEDDTRDWGYVNSAGPNAKTDYRHVMAGVKVAGGNPYVFLGAERIDDRRHDGRRLRAEPEALQGRPGHGIAKPDRSVNDLLISLEYANGGSNPDRDPVLRVRGHEPDSERPGRDLQPRSATRRRSTPSARRPTSSTLAPSRSRLGDLCTVDPCLPLGRGFGRPVRAEPARFLPQLRAGLDPQPHRRLDRHVAAQGRQRASSRCPSTPAAADRIEKVDASTDDHVAGATFDRPGPARRLQRGSADRHRRRRERPRRSGRRLHRLHRPASRRSPTGHRADRPRPATSAGRPRHVEDREWRLGDHPLRGPAGGDPLAEERRRRHSLLGGATFSITPNPPTGSGSLTVVDNGANDTDDTRASSASAASSIGGPYIIAETQPPAGYIGTSATSSSPTSADRRLRRITGPAVGPSSTSSARSAGSKNGPDGTSLLGGATFTVTPNPKTGRHARRRRTTAQRRRPRRPVSSGSPTPAPARTPSRRRRRRPATSSTPTRPA